MLNFGQENEEVCQEQTNMPRDRDVNCLKVSTSKSESSQK